MDIINSCEIEEDNWENAIIPDFREKKLIEERKKVEEADNILTEELFFGKKLEYKGDDNKLVYLEKEKPKCIENRREKLIENQKQKSEFIKKKKMEQQRFKDIYGEAELDKYYELYGSIQDKYY